MRCVDWNLCLLASCSWDVESHLVWGVWIEIQVRVVLRNPTSWVTPRMRCVDWNFIENIELLNDDTSHTSYEVCGLKYTRKLKSSWDRMVTPRMRCVDWNTMKITKGVNPAGSHLVWGVWIEIISSWRAFSEASRSHLVWGVWIEIIETVIILEDCHVTPRMRCVDWNKQLRWGKGLNSPVTPRMRCVDWNAPLTGGVIGSDKSHLVWGVWIEIQQRPYSW